MTAYLARRVLSLIPVWVSISVLAFLIAAVIPGDPAELILEQRSGEPPTQAEIAALRDRLGLDDPLPVRYGRFLGGAITGDLGTSFSTGRPVTGLLVERFGVTLEIAVPALVLALVLALTTGVASAVRRNSLLDHASRVGALLGASIPSFWLAYLLIILLSVQLQWLPVAGRGGLDHVVLPALTLALVQAAILSRLTRSSMLEVLGEDYVRTHRAIGMRERSVLFRRAFRNAMIPVVTVAGLRFGHLLAGAIIVETVFAWPGLGQLIVTAILNRDYPTIQGFVLFTGTVFALLNLVVDVLYVWIDPRVRLTGVAEAAGGR